MLFSALSCAVVNLSNSPRLMALPFVTFDPYQSPLDLSYLLPVTRQVRCALLKLLTIVRSVRHIRFAEVSERGENRAERGRGF